MYFSRISNDVFLKIHFDLTALIFNRISMLVKCDSDISVFILNCSLTSTFCLRRECRGLKPSVLLILALCDWCAVFFGNFARLAIDQNMWFITSCICEQPQVLLQTGKYDIYFHFGINLKLFFIYLYETRRAFYWHCWDKELKILYKIKITECVKF